MARPVPETLPTSVTSSFDTSDCSDFPDFTPRTPSMSKRVIGCLYATIANVSKAALDKPEWIGDDASFLK